MSKLVTSSTQQTLPEVAHSVTTSDGRFTIHWPLAPQHTAVVKIRATGASRLSAMQHRINDLLNDGHPVVCPLSGKLIKVYRRGLHISQVKTLQRLRTACDDLRQTFVHVKYFTARRDGDLAKLELWGLAERMRPANTLEAEKARGMWRITPHGRAWLDGKVRIPCQVAVLLEERLGYVDETKTMSVSDVPDKFDPKALAEGSDGLPVADEKPETVCH